VRCSEWIALAFFVHLAVAALIRHLPPSRRLAVWLGALVMGGVVVALSRLDGSVARDWAPGVYLLAGYYLSGRTFVEPMPHVEAWLIAWDWRLLGDPRERFASWPRGIIALFDIAYIGCFLLVPAGYAALAISGRSDLADRYWTMVLGAELAAFAPLPYLQTRPPYALEAAAKQSSAASERISLTFMKHGTTGANTLPSGHAAGSLAVALAVIEALPALGVILLILALVIAVATIVARAHYIVDVVTGLALAVVFWIVVVGFRVCG
jgi:membrane-associated phospholipid phosphatase